MTFSRIRAPKVIVGLMALLSLGAGCTNGPPPAHDPADDIYTHIGDEAPSPAPAVPVTASCNHEYYPLRTGYQAEYHVSYPILPGVPSDATYVQRVARVTSNSVYLASTVFGPAGELPTFADIEFKCIRGGLYASGYVDTGNLARGGEEQNKAQITTTAAEGPLLPQSISPGDEWSSIFTVTITPQAERDADGVRTRPVTRTIRTARHAVNMERVTVPAGTYDAMKIQVVTTFKDEVEIPAFHGTEWWAKDVGLVKSTNGGMDSDGEPILTVLTRVIVPE